MNKFLIIDGYNLIFRSFYAMQKTQGSGNSTVAVFFSVLHSLIRETECTHLAVALDSKTKTFRHEMYPPYKQNREKTPEELHRQIDIIEETLVKFGIKGIVHNGIEADDIICSLANYYKKKNEIIIASADKDLLQLVDDKNCVCQLRPSFNSSKWEKYDEKKVKEKYGILPSQMSSYLAILGDTADNVPGVKGIGEKGAAQLLQKYKNLDRIYGSIDTLSDTLKKKLTDEKENAYLSYSLVKLDSSDSLGTTDDDFRIDRINAAEGIKTLKALNIIAVSDRLEKFFMEKNLMNGTAEPKEKKKKKEIKNVFITADEAGNRIKSKTLALFCTQGTSKLSELTYVTIAEDDSNCITIKTNGEQDREKLSSFFSNYKGKLILHNAKNFFKLFSGFSGDYEDINVAAYLLDSAKSEYSPEFLMQKYCGENIYREKKEASLFDDDEPNFSVAPAIFKLFPILKADMEKNGLTDIYEKIEKPLVKVVSEMEKSGILLDRRKINEIKDRLEKQRSEIEKDIFTLCGCNFNIQSSKQLQEVLSEKLKMKLKKKTQSGFSVDAETLEEIKDEHPVIPLLLLYRAKAKLISTYTTPLLDLIDKEDDRLHTTFLQTGTATGRFSSQHPNLQNIPSRSEDGRMIKSCFVAKKGYALLSSDYSQIELAVMAHMSGDENLCRFFRNREDIHKSTARLLKNDDTEITPEERQRAKTINFAVIYGISAFRLSKELGMSFSDAKTFIERYFEIFPAVAAFKEKAINDAHEKGYVETLYKRRRYFPDINSENRNIREAAERAALNTIIQGTAADIMKIAILKTDGELKKSGIDGRLLLTIHDELVFEIKEDEKEKAKKLIEEAMTGCVKLNVPLRVEIE